MRLGLKRYFTGKPCKNGHVAERFTSIRGCTECCRKFGAESFARRYHSQASAFKQHHNASSSAWKKRNREKTRVYNRNWSAANPEKKRESYRQWRKNNPEKAKEAGHRWAKANPDKARAAVKKWEAANPERANFIRRASKINRRAREVANGGRSNGDDIAALFKRQNGRCAGCLQPAKLSIDHIQPIAKGGTSDPSNLQLLCMPCNRNKGKKDAMDWAREHGRLL